MTRSLVEGPPAIGATTRGRRSTSRTPGLAIKDQAYGALAPACGLAGTRARAEPAALEEPARARLAVELPVTDQHVAALHHDLRQTADLASLVAAVVNPHVLRRGRQGPRRVRVEDH